MKLQWKPKQSTEAPFAVDVPHVFTQAFVIEKDSKKFPKTGGWGYALFNSCHVAVKSKDHIFHPYQQR